MAQSKEYISRFLQAVDAETERRRQKNPSMRPMTGAVQPNRIMPAPPPSPQPVQPLASMQPMQPMTYRSFGYRPAFRRSKNRAVRMPNMSPNGWKG
jgi:hypothetical protein